MHGRDRAANVEVLRNGVLLGNHGGEAVQEKGQAVGVIDGNTFNVSSAGRGAVRKVKAWRIAVSNKAGVVDGNTFNRSSAAGRHGETIRRAATRGSGTVASERVGARGVGRERGSLGLGDRHGHGGHGALTRHATVGGGSTASRSDNAGMAKGRTEAGDRRSPGSGTAWGRGRGRQGRPIAHERAGLGLNRRGGGRSGRGGSSFLDL